MLSFPWTVMNERKQRIDMRREGDEEGDGEEEEQVQEGPYLYGNEPILGSCCSFVPLSLDVVTDVSGRISDCV